MSAEPYHVLFLCTGNPARSILAEALIDHRGNGQFKGHGAGSLPKGEVNPLAIELINQLDMPAARIDAVEDQAS
jgi:arsenate reductase